MWGGEQVKLPACSARVSAIRNLPRRIFVDVDDDVVVVDDDDDDGVVGVRTEYLRNEYL